MACHSTCIPTICDPASAGCRTRNAAYAVRICGRKHRVDNVAIIYAVCNGHAAGRSDNTAKISAHAGDIPLVGAARNCAARICIRCDACRITLLGYGHSHPIHAGFHRDRIAIRNDTRCIGRRSRSRRDAALYGQILDRTALDVSEQRLILCAVVNFQSGDRMSVAIKNTAKSDIIAICIGHFSDWRPGFVAQVDIRRELRAELGRALFRRVVYRVAEIDQLLRRRDQVRIFRRPAAACRCCQRRRGQQPQQHHQHKKQRYHSFLHLGCFLLILTGASLRKLHGRKKAANSGPNRRTLSLRNL